MENERRGKALICLLTAAAVLLGTLSVLLYRKNEVLQQQLADNARLMELSQYVDEHYYKDVDENAAMDGALKGYVAGLDDPYSSFLTSDEYGDWKEKESGTSVGIGVTVQADDDGLYVVSVTSGSSAEESGIKADDVIIAVDGKYVSETGYDEAIAAVKGEIGTEVLLTVKRGEDNLDISVIRSELVTITASGQMLEGNIGYIRISAFRENTDEQFDEALEELLNEGAEALIFDLRDNGGGLLVSLEKILDPLLPEGNIAVANYGDGTVKTIVESDANELDIPMAVIVNGSTASAAELFAASLSDFDKAFLVGQTTFGKGVMQDTKTVAGGAVTLTVATYQTVRGECYHGIGITPDYEEELKDEYTPDYDEPDISGDSQLGLAYEKLVEGL